MSSASLVIIVCVAAVTLCAVAVLRRAGVPAPVVLVVAGLIIGFLPFVPDVSLQPDVVLLGLLPLLVYDAAVTSSPTALFRNSRSIGALAVFLVVVTAVGVAVVVHWLGHLSWPMAFVLGTAVGPTDAAAATSIARRLGLPRRLLTLLEGEALFNDATALVLYAAAVTAATTGGFSVVHTVGAVVYSAVAGGAIGLAVGFVGRWVGRRVDDPPIEIAGSILLAYGAYLPAQALHASGVLAAVAAGLYLGWHRTGGVFSARSRLQATAFWETLVFLVNAALFVLVGLSFHTFTTAGRSPLARLAVTGVVAVGVVVGTRLVWMLGVGWITGLARRDRTGDQPRGWRERLVLGWSGMRGAITLAALLAVPELTDKGLPLGGRDDVVYLGFAVIIVTLVGQGLSLPILLQRLRLDEHPSVAGAERDGRIEVTRAALDHLAEVSDAQLLPDELVDGLRAQYLARLHRLEATAGDETDTGEPTAGDTALVLRDLITFQRGVLSDMRRKGRVGDTTMRKIQRDLDLDETQLPAP